ncbi:TPA: hypothetical protein ACIBJ9_004582, partial [Salmonella enterica subsp. enterica serovar Typhi]
WFTSTQCYSQQTIKLPVNSNNTYIKNFITDNKHTYFISYRIHATVITQALPAHIVRRRLSTDFYFQQSRT